MIEAALALADDDRLHLRAGTAEQLPYLSGTFDLVVSTTSFDHWADQGAGLRECARVLTPGGHLVLAGQFSALLFLSLARRRGRARTKGRATRLLQSTGLPHVRWHNLYSTLIRAVTAVKQA